MDICRICLGSEAEKDISELQIDINDNKKSYCDIILFCLDIQISQDSNLSTKLCLKCFKKVLSFHKFKTLAMKNDAYLRSVDSDCLNGSNNEIFVNGCDVKSEGSALSECDYSDIVLEANIDLKEELEVKQEVVQDDHSDDEYLSVIQRVKYEFLKEDEDSKENALSKKCHRNEEKNASETEEKGNCQECDSNDTLKEHQSIKQSSTKRNTNNSKSKLLKCKLCEKTFASYRGRSKHYKLKHLGLAQYCNIYGKNESKTEEKKICEECGLTVSNLKGHQMKHQPNAKRRRVKCKLCEKTFSSHSGRFKHHKIKHLGVKEHCDICNKDVVSMKQHRLVVHNVEGLPHECVPCGRRFISRSALEGHVLVHTKHLPYECDLCEKKFRSKLTMLQHKRQVHDKEKSHMCQFCSKSFFKKYHLQVHLRTHTKEKPYECPDCGKFYSSSTTLKNHRLLHGPLKTYECSLCDMTFHRHDYLRKHMISHTRVRPHKCKYCGLGFGRTDHRNRHQRTAHEAKLLDRADDN